MPEDSDISLSLSEQDDELEELAEEEVEEEEEEELAEGEEEDTDMDAESDTQMENAGDDEEEELVLSSAEETGPESGTESEGGGTDGEESVSTSEVALRAPAVKLTARQRARLLAEQTEDLDDSLGLEPIAASAGRITEEEQLRRSEKSRRRKSQRDQKLEQSKAETIKRLLQKQSTRSKRMKAQTPSGGPHDLEAEKQPHILPPLPTHVLYISRRDGSALFLGADLPAAHQPPRPYPPTVRCSQKGCGQARRYTHARSGAPICSLACYRAVETGK